MRVSCSEFLTEVDKFMGSCSESGSVWMTVKKYQGEPISTKKGHATFDSNAAATNPSVGLQCLVRVTDGKATVSALVAASELGQFQARYEALCRKHMKSLKRSRRKRSKKARLMKSGVVKMQDRPASPKKGKSSSPS